MIQDDSPLDDSDVRAMVRLLGDVSAQPGGHAEKKRFLMDGLCGLIHANAWCWTLACQYEPGKPPVYVGWMHGGFPDERFVRYLEAVAHPASGSMSSPLIEEVGQKRAHLTRTIEQIDRAGRFSTFEAAPLWDAANIGTLLISMRPLDHRSASGIGLYRDRNSPPFTPRESRIAHIILSEVPWLHEQGWPEDRGISVPRLPPRQRFILDLLLEGRRRAEIADQLSLSIHTVSGHVKEVYSHFGVQSHAELISRFRVGNGGDSL